MVHTETSVINCHTYTPDERLTIRGDGATVYAPGGRGTAAAQKKKVKVE